MTTITTAIITSTTTTNNVIDPFLWARHSPKYSIHVNSFHIYKIAGRYFTDKETDTL